MNESRLERRLDNASANRGDLFNRLSSPKGGQKGAGAGQFWAQTRPKMPIKMGVSPHDYVQHYRRITAGKFSHGEDKHE